MRALIAIAIAAALAGCSDRAPDSAAYTLYTGGMTGGRNHIATFDAYVIDNATSRKENERSCNEFIDMIKAEQGRSLPPGAIPVRNWCESGTFRP